MAVLIRPDDEVYRVDAVWLGPQGFTLPWSARYSAYGIWLMLFVSLVILVLCQKAFSRLEGKFAERL